MGRTTLILLSLLLCSCIKHDYIPIEGHPAPIKQMPAPLDPLLSVNEKSSAMQVQMALWESYQLCRARVVYLQNICQIPS